MGELNDIYPLVRHVYRLMWAHLFRPETARSRADLGVAAQDGLPSAVRCLTFAVRFRYRLVQYRQDFVSRV